MKKLSCILLVALITFVSCNKVDNAKKYSQESDFTALKEQLIELNNTLPKNESITTKAKWWKYLLVAAADAGGFFLGGGASAGAGAVTAGCAVSTLVWNLVKEEKKAETKANIAGQPTSFYDSEIALSCVDGAGLIHNKVILDLYEDHGEALFAYNEDSLLPLVAEKVSLETECTIGEASLTIQEQQNVVNKTVNAYATSSTIDEFINNLELSAPERAALLEIVNVILNGFDSIDAVADNGIYCASVQNIISESTVSEEAKQILTSTTSVANASARLWKVE